MALPIHEFAIKKDTDAGDLCLASMKSWLYISHLFDPVSGHIVDQICLKSLVLDL